ncbi:MAG: MFS transporter [Firmicutes bacterium]|nr:MFS transporter [Bacillota bacterium]
MGKLLNIKYGCIHGTYWMYYGVAGSFASAFLLARGYSNAEIGIILAVGNILAVFLQPLIADLADRSKKLSLIGVTQLSAVLLIVLMGLLFVMKQKSAALWVVYMLIMAWMTTLQPLFNSLAFKLEETGVHINFGACRSVGSLAYAVLCAFLGTLVEAKGVGVLPLSGEIVLLMLLASLWVTKTQFDRMMGEKTGKQAVPVLGECGQVPVADAEEAEEINLALFVKINKLFVILNLAVIGVFFSNSILNNFMLQVVEGVGGTSEDMGRIFSVMAFLEIPALFFFDKIKERFSCQFILKFAAICFTLKVLLIYLAESVTMIYVAHLLQTFSFGLFLPAMVSFIGEVMAKGEAVKGQALYTVMVTVSSMLASVLGGIMLDVSGPGFMLLISTIATGLGALVLVLIVDGIKKK